MSAHVTTQGLRFCDTDSLGHVNNAVYAVMLEAGRAEMMLGTGLLDRGSAFGVVIARLELDFLREMTWPGEVRVESRIVEIGGKVMRLEQTLHQGEILCARGRSVLAVIDTGTRRAVPIAPEWRAALAGWVTTSSPVG